MENIISYPGDKSYYETPLYFIKSRYGDNGPWHTGRIDIPMPNLQEAIRAAQARLQNEPYLIVRVIDQNDKIHWTNETIS